MFSSPFASGCVLATLLITFSGVAAQEPLAINHVIIDERLHTSGQPQADALQASRVGRVLVHCQVNARASTFTFLYRVVHEGASPAEAFERVRAVWTPIEHWAQFANEVLSRHGVDFQLP